MLKMVYWKPGIYAVLVGVLTLFFTNALSLQAQTNYGSVRGRVTDTQGAVISDATVSLINSGTHLGRSTHTNESGVYFFTAVDPGTYTIAISTPGFKKNERKDVVVELGATATVDEKLEVGTVVRRSMLRARNL